MTITWNTLETDLGIITERVAVDIPLEASSDIGPVTFSLIAGSLPRGLRLSQETVSDSSNFIASIKGSPTEVRRFTESKFVIRASDGTDIEDRTFKLSVDGSDEPRWLTKQGFLNVGEGRNYFVLDNAEVDFQLEAYDADTLAGDTLEYYLVPNGGELPPGLSLSSEGRITGFTDPVFSVEVDTPGGYDAAPFDITYLDKAEAKSNGFDTFFYDLFTFDYNEPSRAPRRLSRFYTFIVGVSDGANETRDLFRIWVVSDEFLKSDNSIIQVDTNLFRADNTANRIPIWITESDLGTHRANNYLTIYLDVYDPPTLSGSIAYLLLPTNPDGSKSELPPGMILDTITGEIAGRVPYQDRVSKTYTFTMQAIDFPAALSSISYTLVGDWSNQITYTENQAVRFDGTIYICLVENKNQVPTAVDSIYWKSSVATAEKTFSIEIIGEIDSAIEWITDRDLGTIRANQPSSKSIEAKSLLYGGRVIYTLHSGQLPPGLQLTGTGDIVGKAKQFGDTKGPGLTRFYEKTDSTPDESSLSRDFTTTFDQGVTTFDKRFTFKIKARDTANFAELIKEFTILVISDNTKTFANLYFKAFQEKNKRLEWVDFITNNDIFRPEEIYRYGDPNFGIQTEIKVLIYAGIESLEARYYIQAMSRNHTWKQLKFGDVKYATAKDPATQVPVYEAIYVEIQDDYAKGDRTMPDTVNLPNAINSPVLISYDAIRVDSDIPFVSDRDHQRIFPNSIKNMRRRIKPLGVRDRTFLPLWMRSIQDRDFVETGYLCAMVLCYVKPGTAPKVISRIKNKTLYASRGDWSQNSAYSIGDSVQYEGSFYSAVLQHQNKNPRTESQYWIKNFDFKSINFTADRYLIDVIDGEFEDKYLAFPQRGEKLP